PSVPPAHTGADKARPTPAIGRGDGAAPPRTGPSVLVPTEMPAIVMPAHITMPTATVMPCPVPGFTAVPVPSAMRAAAMPAPTAVIMFRLGWANYQNRQRYRGDHEQVRSYVLPPHRP